jgi:hypothetical protein
MLGCTIALVAILLVNPTTPRAAQQSSLRYLLTGLPVACAIDADLSDSSHLITVSGTGFQAREPFTVYIRPQVVAKPVTGVHGAFRVVVPVPPGTTGSQTLQVYGAGCAVEVTFMIAVPASGAPQPDGNQPSPATPLSPGKSGGGLPNAVLYSIAAFVILGGATLLVLMSRTGHRAGP